MHNTSLSFPSTFLHPLSYDNHHVLMFVFPSFFNLNLFLLLLHIFSFLLTKLFSFLYLGAISKLDGKFCISHHENNKIFSSTANISDELCRKEVIIVGEDDNFVQESEYGSPVGSNSLETPLDAIVNDDIENGENSNEEKDVIFEKSLNYEVKKEDSTEEEKLLEVRNQNLKLEESTSKSSIEWRSSTIFRDSETEYPFSSSSRRSSSNWEFYTLFKKYDEEMFFFDRISAQKLAETESFRLINAQPRSISKRIVGKLMTKSRSNSMRMRDPYPDLESYYVAQICLAWEALNWNYNIFRRSKDDKLEIDGSICHARIAQRFQQFQVLLQRFIENEPYEYGRRPEIFARKRLSSPKLLQVPEFLGSEGDEENHDMDSKITSVEFLSILEEAIQTFLNFLKADKKTTCERFKALIKIRKKSTVDLTYLRLLKKINKKKKVRLEEIGRRWKYLKKRKPKEEEEMETFMAIIDMNVVSRVLKAQEITEEQLHWCEDKMSKVRVWDGKMQRDHSPLFFPVH